MAENRKKRIRFVVFLNLIGVIAVAVSVYFLIPGQDDKSFMVGFWTPGKNCDQRFIEISEDSKFFQWKWERKWDGYGRDPDIKPSTYALNDKNAITVSGVDRRGKKNELTGKIEKISDAKIKINNITQKINDEIVKNAPSEIILKRCDENIAEQMKK